MPAPDAQTAAPSVTRGARLATAAAAGDRLRLSATTAAGRAQAAPAIGPVLARLADWVLSPAEECALLGAASSEVFLAWRRRAAAMPAAAATRAALLLELTQLLRSPDTPLDAPESAWLRTPRTEAPFGGRTPLAYMLAGGAAALAHVRRHLEAAAAGERPARRLRSPAA